MAVSPSAGVSTLVPDAPPRPTPEPSTTTQADNPSQAVTPPSTDTAVTPEPPRDQHVDITV